jgi:hypothetical protein
MRSETIVYRGKRYHRYPESPLRQLRVYFYRHDGSTSSPVALHRQKYIDKHGSIPPGHHIHHKDANPLNNRITNLVAISARDHLSAHMRTPERRAQSARTARINQPKTKAWHRSPEGRAWHREHSRKIWLDPKTFQRNCTECGRPFKSFHSNTLFCSRNCMHRNWVGRHRASHNAYQRRKYLERKAAGIKYPHQKK